MSPLLLIIPVGIALFVAWCIYSPTPLGSDRVFQSETTGKLYLYTERWNCHGHRQARQDWWQEIKLTGRGSFTRVGTECKDNVGYRPRPNQPWSYPYLPLSAAQVQGLDSRARELLNPAATAI